MYPTKKLSEICKIIGGGTPSKSNPQYYNGDILWASVRDMKDEFLENTELKISEEAVRESSTHIIPAGNVIIATRVGLGKVCLNKFPTAINQDLKGVLPKDTKNIGINYLFWWFKSISRKLESAGTGATVKGVKVDFIENLEIPLPSLSTQSRIVARLDSAFASIDEQISLLRTNIVDVENIRKSVLFDFFGGKNQLLPLSDYVEKLSGIALPEIYKNGNGEGNIPFYKVGEMNNDGLIMKGATLFFNQELAQTYKIKVFPKGTIVFPKRGGAIFTEKKRILTEEASYDSNVMGLKANNKHLSDEYLFVFMKFIKLGDYADDAGIAQINNKHIDLMKIPLPPLPRQHEIVAHLDRVFVETTALRGEYEAQIRDLGTLKQSLLEEAFAGRLVPEEDES